MDRNREIIRTSIVGIIANAFLAGFKVIVGMLSSSIAIVMDAVNNLSDALSSIITIAGTKLSERRPDSRHPFGYGRVEYLTAMIIAVIVISTGAVFFVESVRKIIDPVLPSYTVTTLVVIIVAVFVKIVLGLFVRAKGKKLKSDALIASGADALFDAVVTSATLLSAGLTLLCDVNLDGVLGCVVSIVILRSGIEMVASPVSELLGKGIDAQEHARIVEDVMSFPEVEEVSDIILNHYGHDSRVGSMHISIKETISAREIHALTRGISARLYSKYKTIFTIGVYATPSQEGDIKLLSRIREALEGEPVLNIHAFYNYHEINLITLDVVPEDGVADDGEFAKHLVEKLQPLDPQSTFSVIVDHNYVTGYQSPSQHELDRRS